MTEATYEINRMTALAEKLRLALQRQREVNETLVEAVEYVRRQITTTKQHETTYHEFHFEHTTVELAYQDYELVDKLDAALAAAREVK